MRTVKLALSAIDSALHGGEQVVAWLPAMSPGAPDSGASTAGVLALTTERIVFHGMLNSAHDQAVPLNAIIAVDLKPLLLGHLTFITVTGSVRFDVNGRAGRRWLAAADAQMERVSRGVPQVVAAPAAHFALR